MENRNLNVLTYFKYDLEKLLDEFNNYYNIKQLTIPNYFRTIFLYFSNLSEISLTNLIKSAYKVNNAQDIVNILPNHERLLTESEIQNNMYLVNLPPTHYYGLFSFTYYFYDIFINYIHTNNEKLLTQFASHIPIIEANIKLVQHLTNKYSQK